MEMKRQKEAAEMKELMKVKNQMAQDKDMQEAMRKQV